MGKGMNHDMGSQGMNPDTGQAVPPVGVWICEIIRLYQLYCGYKKEQGKRREFEVVTAGDGGGNKDACM